MLCPGQNCGQANLMWQRGARFLNRILLRHGASRGFFDGGWEEDARLRGVNGRANF